MSEQSNPIVIGVDTGNRCIKTASHVMIAGLLVSDQKTTFYGENSIHYKDKYYQLSSKRCVYRRNKTQDDNYFVLTLFGIMAELKSRGIPYGEGVEAPKIVLAVGLPPAHIPKQHEGFSNYFKRGLVKFEYENAPCEIEIVDADVNAQGFAAACSEFATIRKLPNIHIVDIGGYTTDIISMENGILDPHCISEDAGMIHLYNQIADKMNEQYEGVPKEQQIDRLLCDPDYELEPGMKQLAHNVAKEYIDDLLRHLLEKGINLRLSKAVFVGGGASRLREFLLSSDLVRNPLIISDIKANAIGFEITTERRLLRNSKAAK